MFFLSDNFHPKIQKLMLEILCFFGKIKSKVEILSTHKSALSKFCTSSLFKNCNFRSFPSSCFFSPLRFQPTASLLIR